MRDVNTDWIKLDHELEGATLLANPKTGEIEVLGFDFEWSIDCETFRAIYLELERKGMYDG